MQVTERRVFEHEHQSWIAAPNDVARAIVASANLDRGSSGGGAVAGGALPEVAQTLYEVAMAWQLRVEIELVRDGRLAAELGLETLLQTVTGRPIGRCRHSSRPWQQLRNSP
jgi:hypothetical protein